MRQAKVSNLEITIIWRVLVPANNKDVSWIDIVMPTSYQSKPWYVLNGKRSNTQEVCSDHPYWIPVCHGSALARLKQQVTAPRIL